MTNQAAYLGRQISFCQMAPAVGGAGGAGGVEVSPQRPGHLSTASYKGACSLTRLLWHFQATQIGSGAAGR